MILALLLQAAAPAPAAPTIDWRVIYQGDRGEIYVDPQSVRREGQTFTIRERLLPAEVRANIHSMIVIARFDCVRRTHAMVHQQQYDQDGRLILEAAVAVPQERDAIAGSPAARIMTEYCLR